MNKEMEQINQSIQFWQIFQYVGATLIAAIFASLFFWYSQTHIYKLQKKKEAIEQLEKELEQKKEANSGVLKPAEKQQKTNKNLGMSDWQKEIIGESYNENIWIICGGFTQGYSKKDLVSGVEYVSFPLFGNAPFIFKLVDDNLKVSGRFISLDNKISAEIIDNEWQINPDNYFKRNYDDNGLEVVDSEGILKFQIDFIDKNTINIHGFFKNGNKYILASKSKTITTSEEILNTKQLVRQESDKVPYMFKYPSDLHFGERVKN